MVREPAEDSKAFITEVCWHYFVNEMTQAEIARLLDVTRLRVNQAIRTAKATGMVNIQIDSPFIVRTELQENLKEALGIDRAIVSPVDPQRNYHRPVGAALAIILAERLRSKPLKSFGVSWGITLDTAIQKLPRQFHPNLEVVSILGGTAQGSSFNTFGIASGFAAILGAHYSMLTAPIYLSKEIDRDLFLSQYDLKEHFKKFEKLDVVLLTCSDVSEKSFLVSNGLPREITPEKLIAAGAIGDVLGHFLDKDGNSVSKAVDDRTIGMPLEQVKAVPEKIMAAAGAHKVDIILAACKRGLVNMLITDDLTATLLLKRCQTHSADQ